jgi:hypothetical protein
MAEKDKAAATGTGHGVAKGPESGTTDAARAQGGHSKDAEHPGMKEGGKPTPHAEKP